MVLKVCKSIVKYLLALISSRDMNEFYELNMGLIVFMIIINLHYACT